MALSRSLRWLMPERKKRNWKEYNESLVRRGEILFDTDFLSGWGRELRSLNKGKEGARYRYPNSLMSMLAAIHVYLLPYRELEGFVRMFAGHVEGLKVPDYTTMWWRISRVKVELDPSVDPKEDVTIAVDSTGIKVRKDASAHAYGCMPRKLVALEQLDDYERWKRRRGYGQRARVESAISSFKRTFGEHVSSVKWKSIVNELLVKASVYNLFVGMNP